eukprot:366155-Chlamydomonas_euryale.AAC.9
MLGAMSHRLDPHVRVHTHTPSPGVGPHLLHDCRALLVLLDSHRDDDHLKAYGVPPSGGGSMNEK